MAYLSSLTLGLFSPFSLCKTILPEIPQGSWDFILRLDDLDLQSADEEEQRIFDSLDEQQRARYIFHVATDIHESHHFHQHLLLPACNVLFNLYLTLLLGLRPVFAEWKTRILAGKEIWDGPPVELDASLKNVEDIAEYYLLPSLPTGTVRAEVFDNPLTHSFAFDNHNILVPVILDPSGLPRPLGLYALLESWTWSLIRALVRQRFPPDYYDWFCSVKGDSTLSEYTLVDHILTQIFGVAYKSLSPADAHRLIATLVLHSCMTLNVERPAEGFFQEQSNHPGWRLAHFVGFLWNIREQVQSDGQLDVQSCCRLISRFNVLVMGLPRPDKRHRLEVLPEFLVGSDGESDLRSFSFAIDQFIRLSMDATRLYAEHPDAFLDASEYLNCVQRRILPRIPMAIGRRPGGARYEMAFPTKGNEIKWLEWFVFSEFGRSILAGQPHCPVYEKNIESECAIDGRCASLSGLADKAGRCSLYGLIMKATR